MQYGIEHATYKRTKKEKKIEYAEGKSSVIKIITYSMLALLISRVILIDNSAPFGLAFLWAVIMSKDSRVSCFTGLGVLLGYTTLFNTVYNLPFYLIATVTMIAASYLIHALPRRSRFLFIFICVFLEKVLFNFLLDSLSLGVNILDSAIQSLVLIPIYYIFLYSLGCIEDLKTKHLYNNEEIISMAILFSIAISGLWGLYIFEISIRNVIALTLVIAISYVNGSAVGAAAGIAAGVILGISSNNMNIFVSVYGVCSLVAGLFKDTGKYFSCLAFLVSFFVLNLYGDLGEGFKLIEGIISAMLFIAIKESLYASLAFELDFEKKQMLINEAHLSKVKEILTDRLRGFNGILTSMVEILNGFVDNDKLLLKGKSSALVENLAGRVCGSCDMRHLCWKRELHYTYSGFSELIDNYYNKNYTMPKELDRKCIRRTALANEAEEIVNNHIVNEMWKNRLVEGRKVLASQINNMSSTITEIVKDFDSEVVFCHETERQLIKALSRASVPYIDLFCFNDKRGRLNVKITLKACAGDQPCVKSVLPIINEAVNKTMCISGEGCHISAEDNSCSVVFEETPRYHMVTYAAAACKTGESYIGDSYSFGRMNDGSYVTIISDGMGSGAEALKDSKAAVELIEKFQEAGFNSNTAINTLNSILAMRFDEEEKFSTLDLNSVDLYSGEADFIKIGAASSFIKRGKKVEVITSKTLPIGVLDKPDIDKVSKRLKNGDVIVSVSDGILEINAVGKEKELWLCNFLAENHNSNPKELVNEILERARELSGGKPKDDMTVLVSKIYEIF